MKNKEIIKEIILKQIERGNKNFINDFNLLDEERIKTIKEYLETFEEFDNKEYEINIYKINYTQHITLLLKENGKTKYTLDITKEELLKII